MQRAFGPEEGELEVGPGLAIQLACSVPVAPPANRSTAMPGVLHTVGRDEHGRDLDDVVAEHGAQEIGHVDAEVEQRAAAGEPRIEEPRGVGRPRLGPGMAESGAHPRDRADVAAGDRVARGDERGREPQVVRRHQQHTGVGRGREHGVGLGDRARDRLFDENVLAGLGRGDRHLGVERVRRADRDRVDVVVIEHRAPIVDDDAAAARSAWAASADARVRLAKATMSAPAASSAGTWARLAMAPQPMIADTHCHTSTIGEAYC